MSSRQKVDHRLAAMMEGDREIERVGGEPQVLQLRISREVDDENLSIVTEALAWMGITNDEIAFAAKQRRAIITSAARTLTETINIGVHLNALHARSPRAYKHFFEKNLLPFRENFAFKVRTVADDIPRFRDVIGEGFTLESLPSLSVCYMLSTLTSDHLTAARDKGLLAPAATVEMVKDFKIEIATAKPKNRSSKVRELRKARNEAVLLEHRLDELRKRIALLEAS